MSEQTEVKRANHMPWWAVMGWLVFALFTVGLIIGAMTGANQRVESGLDLVGLLLWGAGFVLGVAGLIVRGLRAQ